MSQLFFAMPAADLATRLAIPDVNMITAYAGPNAWAFLRNDVFPVNLTMYGPASSACANFTAAVPNVTSFFTNSSVTYNVVTFTPAAGAPTAVVAGNYFSVTATVDNVSAGCFTLRLVLTEGSSVSCTPTTGATFRPASVAGNCVTATPLNCTVTATGTYTTSATLSSITNAVGASDRSVLRTLAGPIFTTEVRAGSGCWCVVTWV